MACFTVPLAAAAAVSAAGKALPGKAKRNPFAARLGWLAGMMSGGSFLLAIEHVWHGEIVLHPPFLSAFSQGPEAVRGMLHEMATRGTAMAALSVAVWAAMVAVSCALERKKESAPCAS